MNVLPGRNGPRGHGLDTPARPPADPRLLVQGPLDPAIEAIRADLRPHRRRLWLRRIVRRAWLVLGATVVAEAALFALRGSFRSRSCLRSRSALPLVGLLALLSSLLERDRRSARRPSPSTLRGTSATGSRVHSPSQAACPALAGPSDISLDEPDQSLDEAGQTERFVRRQRVDAAAALRLAPPDLFRPRLSRNPAARRPRRDAPPRSAHRPPEPPGRGNRPAADDPR